MLPLHPANVSKRTDYMVTIDFIIFWKFLKGSDYIFFLSFIF